MTIINSRSLFALGLLTASFFVLPLVAYGVFTPGETLDPTTCFPNEVGCTVTTPAISGANTDITSLGSTMYINSSTNRIGIGTSTPELELDIDDGGIISRSAIGVGDTLTTSVTSKLFLWYPKKAAFRVGYFNGTDWDEDKIGWGSTAIGTYAIASNTYSIAMGSYTTASGYNSTAMGSNTTASGNYSTAMNSYATASGENSIATGYNTTASGYNSTAIGNYTQATATSSSALGSKIIVSGDYSFGVGLDNTARTISQDNTMVIMGGKVGIGTVAPNTTFEVDGTVSYTPSADTNVVAGTSITTTNKIQRVAGSGGVDMTVNPQITVGTDGQVVIIQGTHDTNTVKLDDGDGLALSGGVSFTLGNNDIISLMYDSGEGEWIELYRSDNS